MIYSKYFPAFIDIINDKVIFALAFTAPDFGCESSIFISFFI